MIAEKILGVYPGSKCELPLPRTRTPSPVRHVMDLPKAPLHFRDFGFDIGQIDVIYAEDEDIFRETAVRELEQAGFNRANIYQSQDGLGALESLARLQVTGNKSQPLVVLLDVRMPDMDGRECALQIAELMKKQSLQREPFVICCSSLSEQVLVNENGGNFQVVLPKPFSREHIQEVIRHITAWWTLGQQRSLPAWKTFSSAEIDLLVVGEEPIRRMHAITAFGRAGVAHVEEVDNLEELYGAVTYVQETTSSRPLIILAATGQWTTQLVQIVDGNHGRPEIKREPFLVCSTNDGKQVASFNAVLPATFGESQVEWCLKLCRLWWLTRGEGPAQSDDEGWESDSD